MAATAKQKQRQKRAREKRKAIDAPRIVPLTAGNKANDGVREIDRTSERALGSRDDHANAVRRRARVMGSSVQTASRAEAGSEIGRLRLQGLITTNQYQTAISVGETLYSWCSASGMAQPSPSAIDYEPSVRGAPTNADDDERAIRLNAAVTRMREAVTQATDDPRLAWKEIETVCWLDKPPHNVSRLRQALDAIGAGA